MRTDNESTIVKINMELLQQSVKREGFSIGEFMEFLGYSRRTWYFWKRQGGISPTAFLKIGILFDWFEVPDEFGFNLITNRQ